MNHTKTIVVALASLLFGVAAHAQQNNVVLYGAVDAAVGFNTVRIEDVKTTKFGLFTGVQTPNLLGVKGQEDLGGGTSANFVLETGFDLANGSGVNNYGYTGSRLFGRQATLGIVNKTYGGVDIGRARTASANYFAPIDPFGVSFAQASAGTSFGSINQTRYSSLVQYTSPVISGFSGSVGYSFGTGMDAIYGNVYVPGEANGFSTNNNMRAVTLGVNYANGPWYAAVTYDTVNPDNRFKTAEVGNNVNSWTIGGTYDFKVAKVALAYGQTRNGFINGQTPLNAGGVQTSWSNGGVLFRNGYGGNSFLVGASAPINERATVMASYSMLQPQGDWSRNQLSQTQDVASLGATYKFSKRTSAYAAVSYSNNFSMINADSTFFAAGLTHTF